jgi:hypothetical protein
MLAYNPLQFFSVSVSLSGTASVVDACGVCGGEFEKKKKKA